MNFSNPIPIKSNQKKSNPLKTGLDKMWAGLSMVSLMAPGATTKDNIPVRNAAVIIFIVLIAYLGICGVYLNVQWLKHINISGGWFYYLSIPIIVFVAIEFLNIEKKVREFAMEKKIIYANKKSVLEKAIGKGSQAYIIISAVMDAFIFFYTIVGIIFYDRWMFVSLLAISILLTSITGLCKKTATAKKLFIAENIISISFLLFILLNHFLS